MNISNYQYKKDCSSCIHSSVCKFKEEFMKVLDSSNIKLEPFMKLKYECSYYQSNNYCNYRDLDIKYRTLTDLNLNNSEACTKCDFMKNTSNQGLYVGDIPCEFCPNNPYKISAIDTTSTSKTIINESNSLMNKKELSLMDKKELNTDV